eukprot:6569510-Prymnesium_polylepis.1
MCIRDSPTPLQTRAVAPASCKACRRCDRWRYGARSAPAAVRRRPAHCRPFTTHPAAPHASRRRRRRRANRTFRPALNALESRTARAR